jgi:hypothetical protein
MPPVRIGRRNRYEDSDGRSSLYDRAAALPFMPGLPDIHPRFHDKFKYPFRCLRQHCRAKPRATLRRTIGSFELEPNPPVITHAGHRTCTRPGCAAMYGVCGDRHWTAQFGGGTKIRGFNFARSASNFPPQSRTVEGEAVSDEPSRRNHDRRGERGDDSGRASAPLVR